MASLFQAVSNQCLRRLSIASLLLGLALAPAVAQEPMSLSPSSETVEGSYSRTVPQSKVVPDISGEWRVRHLNPNGDVDDYQLLAVVKKTKDNQEFLVLGEAGVERPNSLRVKWSEADQRFEGAVIIDGLTCKQFMQLLDDGKTMRVIVTLHSGSSSKDLVDDRSLEVKKSNPQIWTRSEELYSSERPEQPSPAYYPPTPLADHRLDSNVGQGNGQLAKGIGIRKIPVSTFRPSRELVEVPGAYELLLALAQHEVMADGLAEKIRTLAASYDKSESQQTELQRDLEKSLTDALDVKFKLEQMQIKLLEEQIASLKNQIGKRQARSKQIAKRRARELIEGGEARREWEPEARNVQSGDAPSDLFGHVNRDSVNEPLEKSKMLKEPVVLAGHTGWVKGVAFSPDGKNVASASWDATIKIWNSETGKELFTLKRTPGRNDGHSGYVEDVKYSPDGLLLASAGSSDSQIYLWNPSTGHCVSTMSAEGGVLQLAFTTDGTRMASAGTTVRLFDTNLETNDRGGYLNSFNMRDAFSLAFSPDGKKVATVGRDNSLRIWDSLTSKELLELRNPDSFYSVAYSPDGEHLATATMKGVDVREVATAKTVLSLKGLKDHIRVVYSPDGRLLATSGWNNVVYVWDAHTGMKLLDLEGHGNNVWGLAFSCDGKRLATGCADRLVRIWDLPPFPQNVNP